MGPQRRVGRRNNSKGVRRRRAAAVGGKLVDLNCVKHVAKVGLHVCEERVNRVVGGVGLAGEVGGGRQYFVKRRYCAVLHVVENRSKTAFFRAVREQGLSNAVTQGLVKLYYPRLPCGVGSRYAVKRRRHKDNLVYVAWVARALDVVAHGQARGTVGDDVNKRTSAARAFYRCQRAFDGA